MPGLRSDLGGHVYTFSYDLAGRDVQRSGRDTLNYTWLNTGKVAQSFSATVYTEPELDPQGHHLRLRLVRQPRFGAHGRRGSFLLRILGPLLRLSMDDYGWSNVYKNATATYDGMNRLVSWAEAGSGLMPAASTGYEYDLGSNIRRSNATYRSLDSNGTPSAYVSTQDNWYRYDGMNRLVTKGMLSGGQIVRGNGGVDYLYNQAGERIRATHTTTAWASIYDPNGYWDPYYGWQYQYIRSPTTPTPARITPTMPPAPVRRAHRPERLLRQWRRHPDRHPAARHRRSEGHLHPRSDGPPHPPGRLARRRHQRRLRSQRHLQRQGPDLLRTVITKQGADTITTYTSNDFGSARLRARRDHLHHQLELQERRLSERFEHDQQLLSGTTAACNRRSATSRTRRSRRPTPPAFLRRLRAALLDLRRRRPAAFDHLRQRRQRPGDQARRKRQQLQSNGDPHEIWYRFGGKQMGYTGNNGTLDTDYATSITNRTRTPGNGAFRFGTTYGSRLRRLRSQSNEAITSYSQGVASGSYTARAGRHARDDRRAAVGRFLALVQARRSQRHVAANGSTEGQRLIIPPG
jgi:hypothetical protein